MAVIRPYRQQTTAGGSLGPGPDARGVKVESAGEEIQRAVGAIGGIVEQKQEEAAAVEASLSAAKGAEYWAAEMQRRKEAAEPGAPDFAGTLQKDYAEWAAEQVKAAKSPRAQKMLGRHFTQAGASLYGEAIGYEAHSRLVNTSNQLDQTADAAATAALTNPALYDSLRETGMVGVAQVAKLNPQLGVKAAQDLDAKLSVAAVTGRIQANPAPMLRALKSEPGKSGVTAVERLTEPDRLQLMRFAESEVNRREAEGRAQAAIGRGEFDDRVRDAQAALAAGKPVMGAPTRAEFMRYYPGDEGDRRASDFEGYQAIQPQLAGAALKPDSELVDMIRAAEPEPGKGYAAAQRRQELLASSLVGVAKARREDPAGFLTASQPALAAERAALGPDPSGWAPEPARAYAGHLLALEASLGLPPAVLSKPEAAAIVDRYNHQAQGGGSAAAEILTEKARWGDAWPAVWRQLAPSLPGTAWAIGYGPMGMEPNAAARLAEESLRTPEQSNAALPVGVTPKMLSDQVARAYAQFGATIANQPNATAMANTHLDAAKRLAARYAMSGVGVGAAAEQAVKEVVDSQFTYLAGPRGSRLRMPAYEPPLGIDAGLQAAGALADETGFALIADAHWVTTADNLGVALMYDGRPVNDRNGKVFAYSWARLRDLGVTTRREAEIRRVESGATDPNYLR